MSEHRCEHPPLRLHSASDPSTGPGLLVWCDVCFAILGPMTHVTKEMWAFVANRRRFLMTPRAA